MHVKPKESEAVEISGLQRALNTVDLSHLSEEERNKLLNVVQRDLVVRLTEKERLKKFRNSLLRRDREAAEKSQALAVTSNCIFCGRAFVLFINPRQICKNCGRQVCRRCADFVAEIQGTLCKLCMKETGYRAMRCNWFYDTVISRFRDFGSTTVAKNIFGGKFKHLQNMAEDELANLISRYGPSSSTNMDATSAKKEEVVSFDQAKQAQIEKLHTRMRQLMKNTSIEYQQLDQKTTYTNQQKFWQEGKIAVEFRKSAATLLRAFSQSLYIATERHRTMQGTSSRNITQDVMTTLQNEVSAIVGHPIKDACDNLSIASDDDLESVAYAEREGPEEHLAQALLEKVLQDRKELPSNGSIVISYERQPTNEKSNTVVVENTEPKAQIQRISVVEGTPTRMEVKMPFNEQSDFTWIYEKSDGTRQSVKLDFYLEHVITGTRDPQGRESFVLSNSGHFGSEAFQSLVKMNRELLSRGSSQGVIIQHQLIVWAAKMEDAGRYIALYRHPTATKIPSVTETEFLLEVSPFQHWSAHPLREPEFIRPLTLSSKRATSDQNFVEFKCTVVSNPAPRCLFYRNNTPVPVVVLPLLTTNHNQNDLSLSSFSNKFKVTSTPYEHPSLPVSESYQRTLLLRINNPTPEDHAVYSCRAWNRCGRTETSLQFSDDGVTTETDEVHNGHRQQPEPQDRLQKTRNSILRNASDIEKTADAHADLLASPTRVEGKPPMSPGRSPRHERANQNIIRTIDIKPINVGGPNQNYNNRNIATTSNSLSVGMEPKTLPSNGDNYAINSTGRPDKPVSILKSPTSPRFTPKEPSSPSSSDTTKSPFVRSSSRRSSGPSIVIDRRSQKRRKRPSDVSADLQDARTHDGS